MIEKENQVKNVEQSSRKNLYLSLLAVICIVLSLTVSYPLSMKEDTYSNTVLTVLAYSFYILQGTSFVLAIVTFINGISFIKTKKDTRSVLVLLIDGILMAMFSYEMYWLLSHL